MIVINSYDAAVGLLEAKSANTSDRPRLVMAERYVSLHALCLLQRTGPEHAFLQVPGRLVKFKSSQCER